MKKLFSFLVLASAVAAVNARETRINIAMPAEETTFNWENDSMRVEVSSVPCDDEFEVTVAVINKETQEPMMNPVVRTNWEKPAVVTVGERSEDGSENSMTVVVQATDAQATVWVEVTE